MGLADLLPPDWIDLCPGEAEVIRNAFLAHFKFPDIKLSASNYFSRQKFYSETNQTPNILNYPHPSGFAPLIKLLEEKHNAPIIITNGAKQALAAIFYALKQSGHNDLGYLNPTWQLIKPLAEAHGLKCSPGRYDCYLSICPNNPDGDTYTLKYAREMAEGWKSQRCPYIHDAAYYSPIYLPDDYEYGKIGDVQIFSLSKMLGLSSLRIGYLVFHDTRFYKLVQEYVEMMTVGVSVLSQIYAYEILKAIKKNPDKERRFIVEARDALYKAKFLARTIRRDILRVREDVEQTTGMFLWAKCLKPGVFEKAKIRVSWGGPGYEDYVRINLAVELEKWKKAVDRMNKTAL